MIMAFHGVILHKATTVYSSGRFSQNTCLARYCGYSFTVFIGSFTNYLTYVVLSIGYLTYILTDKPQLIY